MRYPYGPHCTKTPEMSRQQKIASFDPSGVGLKNGHFIGLPFGEEDAQIVLLPVGWDVTVSYMAGTSTGPLNILDASSQLDLYDPDLPDAWKVGIYMRHHDLFITNRNEELRPLAERYIDYLEDGGKPENSLEMAARLEEINNACKLMKVWVYEQTKSLLKAGKCVGVVGGDHSSPLGFLEALGDFYPEGYGVLQIDAHQDLRKAYEGFEYSHASIFYNAMQLSQLKKLVQVGIRDTCEEELGFAEKHSDRIAVFTNSEINSRKFSGESFNSICQSIVEALPKKVYISFDIDGLLPYLCPNTGTPVPGGFEFDEAIHLIRSVVDSGREIIGFDLCEVAGVGNEWDGNVGARILYKLCNFMAKSRNLATS